MKKIFVSEKILEVTGVGYEPRGEILWEGEPFKADKAFELLLKVSLLCNNSELYFDESERRYKIKGDPTEGALITLAYKAGLSEETRAFNPPLREIPFSSERMRMTTLHSFENKIYALTKGALEIILERSSYILVGDTLEPLSQEKRKEILQIAQTFSESALRVLAFAYREVEDLNLPDHEIERELIFLGFAGMMDPQERKSKKQ